MAKNKLSDGEAKKILLNWPKRTKSLWATPAGVGYWISAQPTPAGGTVAGPKISSPGAKLFNTQPDGMYAFMNEGICCDVIAIEVCGTVQNLNDKRSRYIPASHSLMLHCKLEWLMEEIPTSGKGVAQRWKASQSIKNVPTQSLSLPVRHLRVLYALPNDLYRNWCQSHCPTGYEFFCTHSALESYRSQKLQEFLRRMSVSSQFYRSNTLN